MSKKNELKKTVFEQVQREHAEYETKQEARNATFMEALERYIVHCGGDVSKPTEAQRTAFAEALALWVIDSGGEE
jgi:hypothetical protein